MEIKECDCDACDAWQEGYCTEPEIACNAISNDDLFTEEEYDRMMRRIAKFQRKMMLNSESDNKRSYKIKTSHDRIPVILNVASRGD